MLSHCYGVFASAFITLAGGRRAVSYCSSTGSTNRRHFPETGVYRVKVLDSIAQRWSQPQRWPEPGAQGPDGAGPGPPTDTPTMVVVRQWRAVKREQQKYHSLLQAKRFNERLHHRQRLFYARTTRYWRDTAELEGGLC